MLKATLLARYKQRKWYANANAFFASDRKDELSILPDDITTGITNSTYFDINIDGGYYFNDTWSVFLRLNNVLNSNYQKYTNFQVQGFQVLGGVTYRFDL
jgi:outer membrane cobalamin receptor